MVAPELKPEPEPDAGVVHSFFQRSDLVPELRAI